MFNSAHFDDAAINLRLAYLTNDSLACMPHLVDLNRMGFVTDDSQPGHAAEEKEDRIPDDMALYSTCMNAVYPTVTTRGIPSEDRGDEDVEGSQPSVDDVDVEYEKRGGTWTHKTFCQEAQRAYITGAMFLPADAVAAIAVLLNRSGFVASCGSVTRVPVTYCMSNGGHMSHPMFGREGLLAGCVPPSTYLPLALERCINDEELLEDIESDEGRPGIYFTAFDAQFGRHASGPDGLFTTLMRCMREVVSRIGLD